MSQVPHRLSGRSLGLGLSVLVLTSVSLAVWLFLTASESPPADILPGEPVVSSIDLEGVDLKDFVGAIDVSVLAPGVRPAVSRQAAEQEALDSVRRSTVKDAVFARVVTARYDGPAWIVSLDRPDAEYHIVIVDAETGDSIMGATTSVSGPSTSGFHSP